MEATLPAASAASAHGTGAAGTLTKLFHWTCVVAMVSMAAAHGGSLLTMASNFITMHILPGLASIPQAVGNLGSAFAHAAGVGAAPPIDPTIVMDHTSHAGHAAASLPSLSAEWASVASPEMKAAFSQLPPDLVQQFNQSGSALQSYIVENYKDLSAGGQQSLADIIKGLCVSRPA